MDRFLRRATPLVLLAMAGLVWFEKALPGRDAIQRNLGEDAVLRFVLGILCVYVLLLVVERQRLEQTFKQVLGAFREFRAGQTGQPRPATAEAGPTEAQAQHEAVRILVGALDSDDPEVRSSSAEHLKRLTGQDLGEDPAAWRQWLASTNAKKGG